MPRISMIVLALGTVAALSACARQQEEVAYVEPEPIASEPAYTKY